MLTNPLRDMTPDILPGKVYDGYVINNVDQTNPQNTMDRAQIRIPGFHTGVPDSDLPWADQHFSVGANGAAPGMGEARPLPLYTKVRVEFLDKDGYHPIITAVPKTTDLLVPGLHDDPDYPNLYGHVDSMGGLHKTKLQNANDDPSSKEYIHPSGATYHIDKDGNLIGTFKSIVFNCADYTVHASDKIILDGPVGISKNLNVMQDVVWGGNTSATNHEHSGVTSGSSNTYLPVTNTSVTVPSSAPTALAPRTAPVINNMANMVNLGWLVPFIITLLALSHGLT
jgi:hypothetical protein